MDIRKLPKMKFMQKIRVWAELRKADRHLLSRPTAKGHIHRIGDTAKPSGKMSSHARARLLKRKRSD